jgi:hypothetical protein
MPNFGGMSGTPMMGQESGTNLLSILVDVAFGFVAGLIIFFGFQPVIEYGSKLAEQLFNMTPQGAQMAQFGMAATYAPYVILAPIGGLVLKELASVRSIKSFAIFAAAILAGLAIAFFTQGYFGPLIKG